jgi:hypothetical protein
MLYTFIDRAEGQYLNAFDERLKQRKFMQWALANATVFALIIADAKRMALRAARDGCQP